MSIMRSQNSNNTSSLLDGSVRKRRVFFSFHYSEEDTWRANQVRQSWRFRKSDDEFRFIDASIWEQNKRRGDESVKALLREKLDYTSVTCVLCGESTYSRRWVRYEIAQSVIRSNGLLTVKIHGLGYKNGQVGIEGHNPLDFMGVYRANGGVLLAERAVNGDWIAYQDYTRFVELVPGWEQPVTNVVIPLSRYARVYDYKLHDGASGLADWVATAAMEAGR